jgi:transcriptional regulator with XRE-family HTH domain
MATDIGKRLGQRIRELRQKAGLSQASLAERLGPGVAVETVSRFERGAQVPTFAWVERIAAASGTDLAGFLHPLAAVKTSPELERILELLSPLPEDQLHHVHALLSAHLMALAQARVRAD